MLLDRDLSLELLDVAYEIAVADPDPKSNRQALTVALRDHVSDQEAQGKTKKCLTRVWLNPPLAAQSMIEWARANDPGPAGRPLLHFGALLATFPFIGVVARVIGQQFRSEGSVVAADVRSEARRIVGDRSTVEVAARKAYTTLARLKVIEKDGQILRPVEHGDGVPELAAWFTHAVMLTRQVDELSVTSAAVAPELLGVRARWSPGAYSLLEGHNSGDTVVLTEVASARPFELRTVDAEDDECMEQVRALWRIHRKWLGFLPDQGFTDRAVRGTLIAAVVDSRVVGYVLYDLPRSDVKLVHLCVAEEYRGKGVAQRLVDEVSSRHRGRMGIAARCRRDYPANSAWPRLGFVAVGDSPGRSKEGHLLTDWYRDHGHPDLFTYEPSTSSTGPVAVVIDHNVAIDLVGDRAEGADSRHLDDAWLSEYITLCITDEVDQEIDKRKDADERHWMRAAITRFQRVKATFNAEGEAWNDLVAVIEDAAPNVDPPDHRHLARAAAGDATIFVTRDQHVVDAADEIRDAVGVQVFRPEELIAHLDRLRASERYEPVSLHATAFNVVPVADDPVEVVKALLNYGQGERKASLEAAIRVALADPAAWDARYVLAGDGRILGGFVRRMEPAALITPVLRVRGADRMAYALARQLASLQREHAAGSGRSVVRVTDEHMTRPMRDALAAEGYESSDGEWTCHVDVGIRHIEDLDLDAPVPTGSATAIAAALEHRWWPLKVVGAGIPTFMIPIRPEWAEQLFDTNLAASTLFGREARLGLSREHVYYRKPRNSGGLAPPARLLWYVSGRSHGQAEGSVRAASTLVEVIEDRPLTIFSRFERLGIYSKDQVQDAADPRGLVMALRFVDTELLERPIPLSRLRELCSTPRKKFFAPQSPRYLDEELFVRIYEEGSRYAG